VALGRQVTREASIYLAGFVGAAVLQFLAVPIYTRYLGPERYSYYALTLAITTSLAGLLVIGGDIALTRFWFEAESQEQRRNLALTWISFLTAWSIIVVGVVVLFAQELADWLRPDSDLGPLLIVGLAILVPAQLSRMLAQVMRNEFRPVAFALTTVAVGAMGMGFGIALAVGAAMGVMGILLGTVAAEILGCVIRFPLVRADLRGSLRRETLGPPLRFGIPFVPASIAMWVFTGADRIAVARYLPDGSLGGYAVAATLVAPFSVLLTALGQAWIPRVTQEYAGDPARAARSTGRAIELSLILYSVGATILAVAAPLVIGLVAGPGYDTGAAALPLLALGSVFLGTSLFTGTGYTLAKRTSLVPVLTVVAALVNTLGLVLLVPRWGVVGAAVAVCVGYLTLTVGSYLYSQRHFPVVVSWLVLGAVTAITVACALSASIAPASAPTYALGAVALVVQFMAAHRVAGRPARRSAQPVPVEPAD
jgi:O-antigen/teichoic acid export membrane protein